jgi:hypothetical protein
MILMLYNLLKIVLGSNPGELFFSVPTVPEKMFSVIIIKLEI